jgi:uncharacterized protein
MQTPLVIPASPPLRLVLDTNVWLDLLWFDDPQCAVLRQWLADGSAIALTDQACHREWQRVLEYPALRLDSIQAAALRARFDAIAVQVTTPSRRLPWPAIPRCRDPDDQKFLELGCAAAADLLLTRDDALLALASRARTAGLFRICRPRALPLPPRT